MKKITQNLVKGLLVIVLFTGVSVALSTTGLQTVSEANASVGGYGAGGGARGQGGQVSASTVNQYLVSRGYTVQSLSPVLGSTNWRAYTIGANGAQYITTIYVQSSSFIGQEDVAL